MSLLDNIELSDVKSAEKFAKNSTRGGRSVMSFTLTYTEANGKRVTLSNGLMDSLNLSDKVYIGILADERKLILSNHEIKNMVGYNISKRTIYNARAVAGVVEAFGLQPLYDGHSSHTFNDVELDSEKGIAVVAIPELKENID